jgi:hypothetical protein
MVDEIVVGFEDAVREPVVAHKLPDVFDRIELGAFRRQRNDGDVGWHGEVCRGVPACLVNQEHGVRAGCHRLRDLGEMQVHRLGIAGGQDQGRALALLRADGTEDVGRSGALITGSARAGAALGPAPRDFVLLADPRLILEPNLYCLDSDRLVARDLFQARGEAFLKSSIAPAACAWWRGRAESLR